MRNLKNYVLVFTKRLDLKRANKFADEFKDYYAKKGLKVYYRVVEEGNPGAGNTKTKSHRPQCSQKVLFFRDIDEDDADLFGDELKLKRKIPSLRLYRDELIIGKKEL